MKKAISPGKLAKLRARSLKVRAAVKADLPQIAAQAKEVIEAAIASGKLLRGTDLENKPQAKDQNELGN